LNELSVGPTVERVFREDHGLILASTIRFCDGDFELAEDVVQEAFETALERWIDKVPDQPTAWILTTARNRARDRVRRKANLRVKVEQERPFLPSNEPPVEADWEEIPDDRLKLIFTCGHPALALEARVALTLQTVAGLKTPEISRAFLIPEATMAQRLVRAKRKIRDAGIPYCTPAKDQLPQRLRAVLSVLYLVFKEGYASSKSDALIRPDLSAESIRLTRVLNSLLPSEPEVMGLLSLMLFHDSRREARTGSENELVTLDHQDRKLWNHAQIAEASTILDVTLALRRPGAFQIQGAIAALHATSPSFADTDWDQIAALYRGLFKVQPSPVVAMNAAVAVGMARGPEHGLRLLHHLESRDELPGNHRLHAAIADLYQRSGELDKASRYYREAVSLCSNPIERDYLSGRLRQLI